MTVGARLGTYWPMESFWHHRDPRTILATTMALFGITLYFSSLVGQGLIFIAVTILYITASLPLKSIVSNVRSFQWILLLTFLANLLWPYGLIPTQYSLLLKQIGTSLFYTLRLLNMILLSIWLTMTVRVTTLLNIILHVLQPCTKILPINEIILAMSVAIQFFPILQEELEEITLAQRARSNGRAAKGIKAASTLVPLLVGALRRAQEMATAIESRGYKEGKVRTIWPSCQWTFEETIIMATIIFAVFLLIYIYHWV